MTFGFGRYLVSQDDAADSGHNPGNRISCQWTPYRTCSLGHGGDSLPIVQQRTKNGLQPISSDLGVIDEESATDVNQLRGIGSLMITSGDG